MQEVQEKINELLEESKRDGNHDVVSSYLSRVLVTAQYQHERLIACPEHVKVIDLLVSVLKQGYATDRKGGVQCEFPNDVTIYFYGELPESNPIYHHFVASLGIKEIDLDVIKQEIKSKGTWKTSVGRRIESQDTIDKWCFLFATGIRFTNIYLYCCTKFEQFGWKKLAWVLLNTRHETYETSMRQVDQMLREQHGYDGFVYLEKIERTPSHYALSGYLDEIHKSSKLHKLIE
jgi:hypothetical protein